MTAEVDSSKKSRAGRSAVQAVPTAAFVTWLATVISENVSWLPGVSAEGGGAAVVAYIAAIIGPPLFALTSWVNSKVSPPKD